MAKQGSSAKELAEALGCTFAWEFDDDADLSWMTDEERAEPHEVLGCVVRDRRGAVLASLWGIVDADQVYGRQVEDELATEALADIRASVFDAI